MRLLFTGEEDDRGHRVPRAAHPNLCRVARVCRFALRSDPVPALLRQPEVVVGTWRAARREPPDLTEGETQDALHRLDPLWEHLFPAERVVVGPAGADIRLRLDGLGGLVRDLTAISPGTLMAAT